MAVKLIISGPTPTVLWCRENIPQQTVARADADGYKGDGWSVSLKYDPELFDENGFLKWTVTFDKEEHATMYILSGVGEEMMK